MDRKKDEQLVVDHLNPDTWVACFALRAHYDFAELAKELRTRTGDDPLEMYNRSDRLLRQELADTQDHRLVGVYLANVDWGWLAAAILEGYTDLEPLLEGSVLWR